MYASDTFSANCNSHTSNVSRETFGIYIDSLDFFELKSRKGGEKDAKDLFIPVRSIRQ